MIKRAPIQVFLVAALLLAAFAGCGGDDDKAAGKQVDGTFVGKLAGTNAFVAVVAPPAAGKQDKRQATVYVADGARLSELYSGPVTDNGFVAASEDGKTEATGELEGDTATGTVTLPGGKEATYKAGRAAATAGLYDLQVASDGEISGASATGVGLTGKAQLQKAGSGTLELADGTSLKFAVAGNPTGKAIRLKDGQVRLIVLPDGKLRGAGKSRRTAESGGSAVFIRSSSSK